MRSIYAPQAGVYPGGRRLLALCQALILETFVKEYLLREGAQSKHEGAQMDETGLSVRAIPHSLGQLSVVIGFIRRLLYIYIEISHYP